MLTIYYDAVKDSKPEFRTDLASGTPAKYLVSSGKHSK